MTPSLRGHDGLKSLLVFFLVLLGLVAVGRLAMAAWMTRPAPQRLPEVGARTDEARPFLLVIIDGLRESAAWDAADPPMPWLRAFARRGAWGTAIAGEPTLTAPCVRALLTGRRPDLLTGFRNFNAPAVQGSIIGYLRARGARTAHGGDAAAFQFCRPHYAAADVLQFPDQGPTDQGDCDRKAVPHVLAKIAEGCDCVTLHVTGPDHAGHKWTARSRRYWQACRTVDDQIRRVIEAFLARHSEGTVLVASDHGVSAMGTHGGGELDAKRAPFAIVGPGVARIHAPDIDQCALAPTLCALLGLPQPPLADAPPHVELMDLPPPVEEAALDAYLQARLIVARELHGDAVDFIERKRAELTVEEFADRVNALLLPNAAGHGSAALGLGALWLMVLVALVSTAGLARRRAAWIALGLCVPAAAAALGVVPPLGAGVLGLVGTLAALYASGLQLLPGGGFTLACLSALPVLTAAGYTLQETFVHAEQAAPVPTGPIYVLLLLAAGLLLWFWKPRAMVRRFAALCERTPGLLVASGGVLLGFTLTMRPFIDPYVHVLVLYAIAAGFVWLRMVLSPGARARPRWERWAFLGVGFVLFAGTRIAEGIVGETWVNTTAMHDTLRLVLGAALTGLVVVLVPWRSLRRDDVPGLVLAGVAMALGYVLRFDRESALSVSVVANLCGLGALLLTFGRGTPDGRLLVRLLTAIALARRLSVMDAEFATFTVAAVGAVLAARLRVPSSRAGLAWLALGLVALRTGLFHAMGFVESFSTLDVGQAFAGLGKGDAVPLDAAGGAVITWQIVVASLQLALRMALPWILIVAAVLRALERTPRSSPGAIHCLLSDLAVSFAARGAAIAVALWAWWRNAWWISIAYTVYAYAAADVLLLLTVAALLGVWRRPPA